MKMLWSISTHWCLKKILVLDWPCGGLIHLYMRHCKLVHQSQSQNSAMFTSHIWSILRKTNILFFSPKYLGLPVLTKYFVKKNSLCPEEGLNFCYFNLTLGHFFTFNTWHSQSCRYGKYLSFATFVTPITVLGAEQFEICNVFFSCRTLAEEVLSMSRNQNWSLLR